MISKITFISSSQLFYNGSNIGKVERNEDSMSTVGNKTEEKREKMETNFNCRSSWSGNKSNCTSLGFALS